MYKQKYIKYKSKYLDLQKQINGGNITTVPQTNKTTIRDIILNSCTLIISELGNRTDCNYTMEVLWKTLTGEIIDYQNMYDINGAKIYDNIDEFIDEKDDFSKKFWETPIIKPIHIAFAFQIGYVEHYLVIEKYSDENEIYWRIYQSWAKRYSLPEWLGIDNNANIKEQSDIFGSFKKLSKADMKKLFMSDDIISNGNIEHMVGICRPILGNIIP